MKLPFTKMQGAGNDFILVNGFKASLPPDEDWPAMARCLCHRRLAIGADGLIFCLPQKDADFRMRIFNSDGSEAEMCGNGIRCAAIFMRDEGIVQGGDELRVATLAGLKKPGITDAGLVRVDMGQPFLDGAAIPCLLPGSRLWDVPVSAGGWQGRFCAVGMGNPHCIVTLEEDIAGFPVDRIGPLLEVCEFFPAKTNVEFVNIINNHEVNMRVWERGCGETLACGTGACATTVALIETGRAVSPLKINMKGGSLEIAYEPGGTVYMTGPAEHVFSSTIEI